MGCDETLAAIDAAIEDWETGADAMRRAADGHVVERPSSFNRHVVASLWRGGHQVATLDEHGHWTSFRATKFSPVEVVEP